MSPHAFFLKISSCRRKRHGSRFQIDKQTWNGTVEHEVVVVNSIRAIKNSQSWTEMCGTCWCSSPDRSVLRAEQWERSYTAGSHRWDVVGAKSREIEVQLRGTAEGKEAAGCSRCTGFLDSTNHLQHQQVSCTPSSQQRSPGTRNKAGNTSSTSKVTLGKQTAAPALGETERALEVPEEAKSFPESTKEQTLSPSIAPGYKPFRTYQLLPFPGIGGFIPEACQGCPRKVNAQGDEKALR